MQNQETQERMFNLISGWQQSEVSQKLYCEQHGIRYHVFHYWYKRFRESRADNKVRTFIPLQIKAPATAGINAGIELVLANGNRILFHEPVSADFIKSIIN